MYCTVFDSLHLPKTGHFRVIKKLTTRYANNLKVRFLDFERYPNGAVDFRVNISKSLHTHKPLSFIHRLSPKAVPYDDLR